MKFAHLSSLKKILFSLLFILLVFPLPILSGQTIPSRIQYEFVTFTIKSNEKPNTKKLHTFAIGKYEVSYALWYKIFTWATNNKNPAHKYTFLFSGQEGRLGKNGTPPQKDLQDGLDGKGYMPVTNISWIDAIIWCNAFNEYNDLKPLYYSKGEPIRSADLDGEVYSINGEGIKLPDKAEWMFAAKNGSDDTTFTYAGSNDINDVAWYYQNACDVSNENKSEYGIHPSGEKKPNAANIYDMNGNVAELCFDSTYPANNAKLVCGGSWLDFAKDCQIRSSASYLMNKTYSGIGLRLAYNFIE
jgi:formylglycine-generating enzyme required for sulfatase activity